MMLNLTPREIIELRIKALEPFVAVASKAGLESDIVIQKAENAWQWAVKPLMEQGWEKAPPLKIKAGS